MDKVVNNVKKLGIASTRTMLKIEIHEEFKFKPSLYWVKVLNQSTDRFFNIAGGCTLISEKTK